MLSQRKIQAGSKNYYLELGREDYYTEKNNVKGRWLGEGAAYFGLEKEAIEKHDRAFINLIEGKDPTGEKELRRGGGTVKIYRSKVTGEVTKKSNPVCGYDNTFSAPKDVSILWALSDKETQSKILKIHQEAVNVGLSYIDDAVYTRTHSRNPDGTRTVSWHKAKGTFATFDHFTSRELDPQLHTHAVLLNVAVREDGQGTGAVDGNKLWKVRYIAGQAYQNHLRRELEKQFGVKTFDRPFSDEKGVSFGISGVTQNQRERFSLRSLQIEKHITSNMTGAQINAVALKTRRAKTEPLAPDLLFGEWRQRGKAMGFEPSEVFFQQKKDITIKQRIGEKISQKADEYFDKKDKERVKVDESKITADDKTLRDVAQSLARKIEHRLDEQAKLKEKLEEYNQRRDDFIARKLALGITEKEASKLHKKIYKEPSVNMRVMLDPNLETVTKNNIMFTYMRFNRHATKEDAKAFTECFIEEYMSKEDKKIHPLDEKKNQEKSQQFKPKEQKEPVFKLTKKGQDLAIQRTTREELVDKISDISKRHKELSSTAKGYYFQYKAKQFDGRLKWYYATGRVSRRKYLQLRDQKYLEYSKFKLVTLQVFGVLSHRQVKYAIKHQKQGKSPYELVNSLQREGRITKEEAKELRFKVFGEVKQAERQEKEASDRQAIANFKEKPNSSRFDYERTREWMP